VVIEVSEAPLEEAALQTQTTSATYQASLLNKIARSDLLQRIESLLSSQSLLIERKRGKKVKRFDIRPLILELSLKEWSPQRTTLHMRLSMLPGKTGRADDVLAAIGLDPLSASIKRTEIRLLPKRQAIP
jgi:hypothetical protein